MERVPLPTDPHEQQQEVMRRAHFTFEAEFCNTLKLLADPPRDDLPNFLGYCEAWCRALIDDHDAEEAVILTSAQRNPTTFDPAGMIQILQGAENNFITHLRQEVEDLAPERLRVFTSEEIRDLSESQAKYYMKPASFATLPFLRSHTPPELKSWPPLPWPVEKFVLPLIAKRHSGYWDYSPYSVN
ncbi:hypothetical protein V1527DRAFT_522322 [Lipomyces starkeyi]